jgi:uncharacterized membrane protein YedE/YeeE
VYRNIRLWGGAVEAYLAPWTGGLLIGCSAVAMLASLGRITGISGIVWGAISGQADNAWRWLFLVGLPLGALLYHGISGEPFPTPSAKAPWVAAAGGLLVGIGVKLGGGCTSGHGVCGIGRLSVRSLVATVVFMTTGVLTVLVLNMLRGGVL